MYTKKSKSQKHNLHFQFQTYKYEINNKYEKKMDGGTGKKVFVKTRTENGFYYKQRLNSTKF